MSKAEERALEYYPNIDRKDYPCKELDAAYREVFVLGYHQAEKDLETTLEDVEIILNAFLDLCIENKEQGKTKRYTDKEWCQEVLKRFKEAKEL